MFNKLRLTIICFGTSLILLFMLCLGAQNLSNREILQLGKIKTAPLPTGFIIGISIISGYMSGGLATALILSKKED